jgi:hypothetical protein
VEELENLKEEKEEETTEATKRKMVPVQTVLSNRTVLVTTNVDMLIQQPVPPHYKLKCYLVIERGLLGFAHTYRMFLGEERQFLMSAKKENFKYYSNFLISKHPQHIHKRTEEWIGRL